MNINEREKTKSKLRLLTYEQGLQERLAKAARKRVSGLGLEIVSFATLSASLTGDIVNGFSKELNPVEGALVVAGTILSAVGYFYGDYRRDHGREDLNAVQEEANRRGFDVKGKIRPRLQRRAVIFEQQSIS